ncbi:TonB-dependent siderophore receptor [Empedobacter tilapiae]|uniref:TonB-dependent receptor n=1 Tax=Empedobacter tilapiae TaxID=2491114 RepID=A0A4Z1B7T6_9FLAO|nr:TonB-dependent receptor [Empedobacter tilapiae]TGN30256.1 TonB-dependent receptor [Empedobacter tilapiae]
MKKNKLLLATLSILSFSTAFAQEKKDTVSNLQEVEIFGDRAKKQRGLEMITRFPGNPQDQVQSISTISEKLIEEQGALTITDAARNVPGVTLFGNYGGYKESMSIRGYRGTPVLKNGVRMDSDFRTASAISDMQGVESIQVIKGAASITQGIATGLGSAGGVINIVTKTPRFNNEKEVGLRYGSWNNVRATFDMQQVLDNNKKFAFRLNGAYQYGESYRDMIETKKHYINPSFAWRPDDKTEVVVQMDYLNLNGVPDRGTVNLAKDDTEALFDMGHKFLGTQYDKTKMDNLTYSAWVNRQITDKINFRVAYFGSYFTNDNTSTGLVKNDPKNLNLIDRTLGRSYNDDRSTAIQADLMGKDFNFSDFKWSWQVGYDYSYDRSTSRSATGIGSYKENGVTKYHIRQANIFEEIQNNVSLPTDLLQKLELNDYKGAPTYNYYYGFMTQQHLSYKDFIKVIGSLRYSYSIGNHDNAVDPMIGLMVSPTKNINLFASWTTSTSLRGATNILEQGGTVGSSKTNQFETGVKTSWFNDRLRANITYFDMNNKNLSYTIYDAAGNNVQDENGNNLYGLAGNLKRKGVELDISGRPLPNVQVLLGYAYLDAQYEHSPAYMDGSAPMNAPKHTANAWVQYKFQNTNTFVDGISLSVGAYYVGERPVNEYTKKTIIHNTTPGVKPFMMPEYTTLNAQIGYSIKKFDFRLFFNNITDEIGYNSYYRGGYINQIDPFNMAGQVVFKF